MVNSPDGMDTDFVSEMARLQIVYVKRFDDIVIFYMKESDKKKRNMRGISMREYPSTIDADCALEIATNPNLYGRTGERAYGNNTKENEYYQDEKINCD
ncbi:hypothetical protein PT286_05415 [Neisseriaceae bacterium ESL0693]|nr:hypothetical protein [Neisseriaceae bacterium ESL0693]